MTNDFAKTDEVDKAILFYIRHKIETAYWNKYQKKLKIALLKILVQK